MRKKKIVILVGSLRKDSYNRKLALDAIKMQPETFDMELVEIGQLVHYNEDLDANPPAEWVEFTRKLRKLMVICSSHLNTIDQYPEY